MATTLLEEPKTKRSATSVKRAEQVDTHEIAMEALREIPEELKQRIAEGKKQLAAGQGIPHDVVMKKMRQRFQCEQ